MAPNRGIRGLIVKVTSITTEFRSLCPSQDGARGPYPRKGVSYYLMGALATKWHCQLDAGATQRVVVKISTETRSFRPKNEAAKPKMF